jgi:CHAT domain-containing protein
MASTVLKLRITGTRGEYKVGAEVEGRQATDDFADLPTDFAKSLHLLQEALLRTTQSVSNRMRMRRPAVNTPPTDGLPVRGGFNFSVGADSKGIQEIGSRLFDCVFQPEIYELYKDALEEALVKGNQLYIKLCVEAPELSYVPWEAMFDKRRLFHLCCYQPTPFARVASMRELDLHIYEEPPLRVLCMVSAPKDFIGTPYELRTDAEQAALDLALAPLTKDGQVKLCPTASGTFRELKTRIVRGDQGKRWDVFLYIGHGLEGSVVFEEDGGSGFELIPADVLRGLLEAPNGPKLVILNSCKGASKPEDRLASTAETLVKGGGIAAVVAMQFDVSDLMATKFSPSFFYNLMLGVPIQRAMTLTRLDLQAEGFSEWITPVLYMQNKNGLVRRDAGSAAGTGG